METSGRSGRSLDPVFSRRAVLQASAAAAGAAAISGIGRWSKVARAQSATGEITVQFETRGGDLEREVSGAVSAVTAANGGSAITIADAAAGNYVNELTLALISGEGPDVFAVSSIAIAQLASAGLVLPLDSYLQAWPDWAQYPDSFRNALLFQGQTWGLPYAVDTHFLYYRKDVLEAVGLPVPWQPATLDDLLAAARTIKAANAEIIPLVLFAGANPGNSTAVRGFLPLVAAYGGDVRDADGKWIIDSCPIREALAFYELTYQTEELVPQSVMTSVSASNAMRAAFAGGGAAIMFDGSWVWDDWAAAVPDIDQKIGYVLHPMADGSAPFSMGGLGNTWFINARTKFPELAWAFVAAMSSKDVVARLNLNDPHIPPRIDSAMDEGFVSSPFNLAMIQSATSLEILPPDPSYQELVGIIQNATGIVATGEVTAEESVQRYGDELTRVLGEENVVKQTCP